MKRDFVYNPEVEALAIEAEAGVIGTVDRCRKQERQEDSGHNCRDHEAESSSSS